MGKGYVFTRYPIRIDGGWMIIKFNEQSAMGGGNEFGGDGCEKKLKFKKIDAAVTFFSKNTFFIVYGKPKKMTTILSSNTSRIMYRIRPSCTRVCVSRFLHTTRPTHEHTLPSTFDAATLSEFQRRLSNHQIPSYWKNPVNKSQKRNAAILVPLVNLRSKGPSVLFTLRNSKLNKHAGEVR